MEVNGYKIKQNADLRDANLRDADLRGADLCDANLCGANLRDANLRDADLRDANLCRTNFSDADLSRANLSRANLSRANLNGANLSRANLSRANLSLAYLRRTNFSDANLCGTNFSDANLRGTNLRDAKTNYLTIGLANILQGVDLFAWKKVDGELIWLLIESRFERSCATTAKCRASGAYVIATESGRSIENRGITYTPGEYVYPDKWDADRWNECSHGIHFFLDVEHALAW